MSTASGTAERTSETALPTACAASSASRVNSSARRPRLPTPTTASSHPAAPRRSMRASASASPRAEREGQCEGVLGQPSVLIVAGAGDRPRRTRPRLSGAARVILRAARRAPDHRHAELAAAAVGIVVRAVHLAPAVRPCAQGRDTPAATFRMPESLLDVSIRMPPSWHVTTSRVSAGGRWLSSDNHDLRRVQRRGPGPILAATSLGSMVDRNVHPVARETSTRLRADGSAVAWQGHARPARDNGARPHPLAPRGRRSGAPRRPSPGSSAPRRMRRRCRRRGARS